MWLDSHKVFVFLRHSDGFSAFALVATALSEVHDTMDFICEMKDGVTIHAVIISGTASPTLHTGENVLFAKNVERQPTRSVYTWRNYVF